VDDRDVREVDERVGESPMLCGNCIAPIVPQWIEAMTMSPGLLADCKPCAMSAAAVSESSLSRLMPGRWRVAAQSCGTPLLGHAKATTMTRPLPAMSKVAGALA
jgi:hypothetical protein